jgi:exonuclease VII large subunit
MNNGKLVRSVKDAQKGDILFVQVSDGVIDTVVES